MGQKERPATKRDARVFMVIFLTAIFILSWTFSDNGRKGKAD